jgi:hypothetical protein
MYRIEFLAHDQCQPQSVIAETQRGAFEVVCALNYTGFTYTVTSCGLDLTEQFENQMTVARSRGSLPVVPTAGGIPQR